MEAQDQIKQVIGDIQRMLPEPAAYEQLAEECSELAQAAIKIGRYMRGENLPRKDMVELVKDVEEEIADVFVCLNVLGLQPSERIISAKLARWHGQLSANPKNRQMSEMEVTDGLEPQGDPQDDIASV